MKLITRGYGENQQIITRGYGPSIVAVIVAAVQQAHGAAKAFIKETLTLVRFDVHNYGPIKIQYHIGRFDITKFEPTFNIIKHGKRATFNLMVHHLDITTKHLINTIRTAIAGTSIKTDENIS